MKLIALNAWGGRAGREALLRFFERNRAIDVFCLQEIWNGGHHLGKMEGLGFPMENVLFDLLPNIRAVLPEHDVFFRPHYGDWYGIATLVRRPHSVIDEGEVFVYKERGWRSEENHGNCARNLQWVTFETEYGSRTVLNLHALWNGNGKTDTDDRLLQSDNIISFVKTLTHPFVIAGDFNLRPDTESLRRLENIPARNLISECNVQTTRSSYYKKPEKHADYVLTSPGISVRKFSVLPDEVSDHLPLYLSFE